MHLMSEMWIHLCDYSMCKHCNIGVGMRHWPIASTEMNGAHGLLNTFAVDEFEVVLPKDVLFLKQDPFKLSSPHSVQG